MDEWNVYTRQSILFIVNIETRVSNFSFPKSFKRYYSVMFLLLIVRRNTGECQKNEWEYFFFLF